MQAYITMLYFYAILLKNILILQKCWQSMRAQSVEWQSLGTQNAQTQNVESESMGLKLCCHKVWGGKCGGAKYGTLSVGAYSVGVESVGTQSMEAQSWQTLFSLAAALKYEASCTMHGARYAISFKSYIHLSNACLKLELVLFQLQ